jgi:nitrogen fixation/metabolism regulation signal transduction histidine kinase
MLAEIEATRARIEYLQRIGAWQEMARRLAHEIKNPLTPIQLAVQEVHERYGGADAGYRKLLDATLEVVEAEVGTLRRLVGEFSDFARLPQAKLEPGDLAAFLREQAERTLFTEEPSRDPDAAPAPRITVQFDVRAKEAKAHLDKQMLRRALINLIRNSSQAIRDQSRSEGRVTVSLDRSGDFWVIDVDDDGPGIPAESRERIFDPYVTTKHDGTGLGLAIVKKVVVEHGGVISASTSPLGGARVRITIPADGSAPSSAVVDAPPPPAAASAEDASARVETV